jgi:glycine cleavage system regulatory protein
MSTSLVLTVIGNDRSGIVESLSQTIADHDGSWMESRMARLAGKFAGVLRVSVPKANADALTTALLAEDSQGLSVIVERAPVEPPGVAFRALDLQLVGQDRPGIVHEIAHAVAEVKGTIDEMNSRVVDATMSGETLFQAEAKLRVPAAVPLDELRGVLEALADELMVDITLDETPGPSAG